MHRFVWYFDIATYRELFGQDVCIPLVQVDIGLLADQVGVTTTDTLDLGQGVHDLLLAVNVGVEQTQDLSTPVSHKIVHPGATSSSRLSAALDWCSGVSSKKISSKRPRSHRPSNHIPNPFRREAKTTKKTERTKRSSEEMV